MTKVVADAIADLDRRFDTSAWIEPGNGPAYRRTLELVASGREDRTALADRFEYAEVPLAGFEDQLSRVRHLAEQQLVGEWAESRELVLTHLDQRAARARAVAGRDDESYSEVMRTLDGLPSDELVADARRVLDGDPVGPVATDIPATQAAERLRAAIEALELDETWTVEVHATMSASMSVNGPLRRVRVRSDAAFSTAGLERLVMHEVGGHVRRWARSRTQPEPLAATPMGRTVPTEEGLALWGELREGMLDERMMRVYAARVLAVSAAQDLGAVEVAMEVVRYVGAEQAAAIAVRAKRGLVYPAAGGGSTKDWGYLGGLRACAALAEDAPGDLALLLGVKWGAEHLPQLRRLAERGRIRPEHPVDYASLKG